MIDLANVEVWKQLETLINARYIKGNFLTRDSVVLTHRGVNILLGLYYFSPAKRYSTGAGYYTELSAKLPRRPPFSFEIKRKHFLSGLTRIFGIEPIQLGFPEIDSQFIVTGTDPAAIRKIFQIERIRQIIATDPKMKLSLLNVHLEFTTPGILRDLSRLSDLFELFVALIEQLREGEADQRNA